MRMKKLAVLAMAAALSVGTVMTASAAWLQEGSNWRYQNDDGSFQAGTWFRDVDGRWYHFDNNGVMQKGWFLDTDGKWYFLAYNGVMQVGLLKVDNQVYYMNPSGDLFLGDMAVNGTTYNFGLYGTTNGQPSVPATATYGGNGNQSLPSGGSGSDGRKTQTPVDKVEDAVADVEKVADTVKNSTGGKVEAAVGEKTINAEDKTAEVAVVVKADENLDLTNTEGSDKETVVTAVTTVVKEVVDSADKDTTVTVVADGTDIPQIPYPVNSLSNAKIKELVDKYVNDDNYKNGSTAEVTVTISGIEVTYTITLE